MLENAPHAFDIFQKKEDGTIEIILELSFYDVDEQKVR